VHTCIGHSVKRKIFPYEITNLRLQIKPYFRPLTPLDEAKLITPRSLLHAAGRLASDNLKHLKMTGSTLHQTIETWISALSLYNEDLLNQKPGPDEWSLGELYIHLIEETNYYFSQVDACIISNENTAEQITEDAETIFANNALPDIKIRGNNKLSTNLPPPVPIEDIRRKLHQLKDQLSSLAISIHISNCAGRTRHPRLGYFSATQWLQFADIHMRHHLRQKARIEAALRIPPGTRI
jgi:hypothetical protein